MKNPEENSNCIISKSEYKLFKNKQKVLKISELFHEITLMVVKQLLNEFENGGLTLKKISESEDYIRLKVTGKTKYKTIEDYIDSNFPFIICKK